MAVHPSARVAPTARIAPGAEIGPDVEIADFVVIEDDVVVGPRCRLEPHVYIKRWTTLGADNEISAGTVLGTDPLDKNFDGRRSYLRIGDGNKIREHYTISRGTEPESETVLGDRNYIMTSGHIAHNCRIGSDCVIASCALVAGYVEVGDRAFLSGGVVVHQFSKIGELAMIGGNTRVNKDAPPYFLYSEFDIAPRGVNVVGLRRAGFSADQIAVLRRAYRILFRSPGSVEQAVARLESELAGPHVARLVEFIRGSKRGICRRNRADASA
ncbi:MAG: acyl-ACP--UDP-N-acetylglucosamine O-acyltransferase [Acidobacteria bacterium]|nr:acyl-ACP--UDP-N-acetylglucosamine O-acyltransferase [Acidobacteriota bacterium]